MRRATGRAVPGADDATRCTDRSRSTRVGPANRESPLTHRLVARLEPAADRFGEGLRLREFSVQPLETGSCLHDGLVMEAAAESLAEFSQTRGTVPKSLGGISDQRAPAGSPP